MGGPQCQAAVRSVSARLLNHWLSHPCQCTSGAASGERSVALRAGAIALDRGSTPGSACLRLTTQQADGLWLVEFATDASCQRERARASS